MELDSRPTPDKTGQLPLQNIPVGPAPRAIRAAANKTPAVQPPGFVQKHMIAARWSISDKTGPDGALSGSVESPVVSTLVAWAIVGTARDAKVMEPLPAGMLWSGLGNRPCRGLPGLEINRSPERMNWDGLESTFDPARRKAA